MNKSNGDIIREAYQNFATGNIPAVFAAFDPSITWHVPHTRRLLATMAKIWHSTE